MYNSNNQKTLGKGLSSLIPKKDKLSDISRQPVSKASYFPQSKAGVSNQILHISPAQIQINPYQPRQKFNTPALESLKNSISEHGIIQPLIVTQTMAGKYELVAGERRLRAARELNLKTVPIIVRTAKDLEKLELSLIENIQREDLNPIERAESYKRLLDNFHLNQEQAAKRLGIARSTLNNNLRLLQLPPDIQLALSEGKITEGQAKLLLSLPEEKDRKKVFQKAQIGNLTVQDTQREIRRIKVKTHSRTIKKDPQISNWEQSMRQALGTAVSIRKRGQSGGVIEIEYYSEEELNNIVNNIVN